MSYLQQSSPKWKFTKQFFTFSIKQPNVVNDFLFLCSYRFSLSNSAGFCWISADSCCRPDCLYLQKMQKNRPTRQVLNILTGISFVIAHFQYKGKPTRISVSEIKVKKRGKIKTFFCVLKKVLAKYRTDWQGLDQIKTFLIVFS